MRKGEATMSQIDHHQWQMPESNTLKINRAALSGRDRRQHRRHDLEQQDINVERFDGSRSGRELFGRIVDISAGGVRIRTNQSAVRPDQQIRVRLELPAYAGICPFVDTSAGHAQPKRDWTGWMTISRVQVLGDCQCEIAGRLVDMEEMDRGMLGLYLSTQPLAA
jgi:hypothetical protein